MTKINKTKLSLILAVALVFTLAYAAPAFAWTHGQFNATTDACAGCHVAHAAQAPKLLKSGPTQTHFCFLCHGDGGINSPFDVKDGYTKVGAAFRPSTAGGFVRNWVDSNNNYIINAGELKTVTSRHNVWGLAGESGDALDPDAKFFTIPGSANVFGGNGFVCGSCHDPHAGGLTRGNVSWWRDGAYGNYYVGWSSETHPGTKYTIKPENTSIIGNPRLLRTSIFGRQVDKVIFQFNESLGTFTGPQATGSPVYPVTAYVYGSTNWCSSCHDRLDPTQGGQRFNPEGHAGQYLSMWRHPMDVHFIDAPGQNTSLATGTPYEQWNKGNSHILSTHKVACLTCHRAHSTTVAVTGWASNWPTDGGGTRNTSALLRMTNRGTCYNCHGGAKYNCWNDNRNLGTVSSPAIYNCAECHPGKATKYQHAPNTGPCSACHKTT